jgi:large subunit ribosomal protein L18
MNKLLKKNQNLKLRKNRIRQTVFGTAERPRLSVSISHMHVSAQIIDDTKQHTLAAVTTVGQKSVKGSLTSKAEWAGNEIAKKAKTHKVKTVVLDRNGKIYHGRIKALADAARAGGLEF